MHYFEDPQNRESSVTVDLVRNHWRSIAEVLQVAPQFRVAVQMPKAMYGAKGDVDIAVWSQPGTPLETLMAVELKTLHLAANGELKSQKPLKHLKQLRNLDKDGWDYVWLFDVIVTEPADGWWHPQALTGFEKHAKSVGGENYGHARFQVNSVVGRPESDAGSVGYQVLSGAARLGEREGRARLLAAFRGINFGVNDYVIYGA